MVLMKLSEILLCLFLYPIAIILCGCFIYLMMGLVFMGVEMADYVFTHIFHITWIRIP